MEASFHEGGELNIHQGKRLHGNFHVSQQLLSMVTLLLAMWIFMNYRTILNILNANETQKIPDIREMTRC